MTKSRDNPWIPVPKITIGAVDETCIVCDFTIIQTNFIFHDLGEKDYSPPLTSIAYISMNGTYKAERQ